MADPSSSTRLGLLLPQYGGGAGDGAATQSTGAGGVAHDALAVARAADAEGLDVWLAGQLIAISSLDEIIKLIRSSSSRKAD